MRRLSLLLAVLALCACGLAVRARAPRAVATVLQELKGRKTVADRLDRFGEPARARLLPLFKQIGVAYPPHRMTLVGLKEERRLEVWVAGPDDVWKHLRDYPILGLSGTLGPKLREGDRQVPEGIYRVESLNPNSLYHLALRVNYPNADDRERGRADGRASLGSDIMIHGKTGSIGCLAMGDPTSEDLFVLAAETGTGPIAVLLSPVDFRVRDLPADRPPAPPWTPALYASIRNELNRLRDPPATPSTPPGSPLPKTTRPTIF